jgi:ATP-dependent DNA helicase RecG
MAVTSELLSPVQYLQGVGPARAERLEKLGIRKISDLLFFFPRDYEDFTHVVRICELEEGQIATTVCTVDDVGHRSSANLKSIVTIIFRDGSGHIRATWFNQPFMKDQFAIGDRVVVSGKPRRVPLNWEMSHPRVLKIGRAADATARLIGVERTEQIECPEQIERSVQDAVGVLPVYRLTDRINQRQMRQMVESALAFAETHIDEALPQPLRAEHGLVSIGEALRGIHFPATIDARDAARKRFVFQELLVLQLALAMRRHDTTTKREAIQLECTARIDARIRRLLPFELTDGQNEVIQEIVDDIAADVPMNRLLQGDVGSGKTIVAIYAMLVAVAHGHQAILMAPTEVLAKQHHDNLNDLLSGGRVRLGFWTGALRGKQREELAERISAGDVDILVGTQAIVQSHLQLPSAAVVVIDEQHRFGVRMRAQLRSSGLDPHYLVMTATPIPRTVAMVEFGDLDTSELRHFPPNRQPTHTYLISEDKRDRFWKFFRDQLNVGRQGMIVTPMIEEKESSGLTSVQKAFETLTNGALEAYRCDLVHGRMNSNDKLLAIENYRSGKTQVLVATSIVEVGMDVPNLSVMVIENAERFGLAALHQLRGRVGRGAHAGYVGVFAAPGTEESRQRIAAFVETHDGFELAARDFELRGPGDLFGTRQHGLPPLRIANLQEDGELLETTRGVARAIVEHDPNLSDPAHAELRRQVLARYGQALDLSDVG